MCTKLNFFLFIIGGIWFVFMDKNLLVNYVTKIFQQSMESIYIKEKFMELCIKKRVRYSVKVLLYP